MPREVVTPDEIVHEISLRRDKWEVEKTKKLHANLALPSYVHGYSLAIQYLQYWFESKFPKDYFRGGIYVDGHHVLDDYKRFSKNYVKKENPKARIIPTVEFDFDRDTLDNYQAPPEIYIRRSPFNQSFFKDYDRDIFLGIVMRALRMNFNIKIRVNTRSQQLDLFNKMELDFRIGATQSNSISADFHIPKSIILNIADRAGFEIKNNEIVDIIEFLNYMNGHSDLPFLFKIRAVNHKAEFFIRVTGLYTHIDTKEKLQLDDGERDGKLNTDYNVEMNVVLTIPIPHYYSYYSATDITCAIEAKEQSEDAIAIYSINVLDIPKVDEHGWNQAAVTEFALEDGDTEIDLSPIFQGENILAQAIHHDMTLGISPSKFINIKAYKNEDVAKLCDITMDWKTKKAYFRYPETEDKLTVVIYYDRAYINAIDTELNNYNQTRIE